MVPAAMEGDGAATSTATLDPDSVEWLRALEGTEAEREAACRQLHAMLLRAARSEVRRRSDHLQLAGPELDDVAHQAAADAMVAILAKAGEFRGRAASPPGHTSS